MNGTLDLVILKTLDAGQNQSVETSWTCNVIPNPYPALHRLEKEKLIAGAWRETACRPRLLEAEASWTAETRGLQKLLRFA